MATLTGRQTGRRARRCAPGGWPPGWSSSRSLGGRRRPDLGRFAAAFPPRPGTRSASSTTPMRRVRPARWRPHGRDRGFVRRRVARPFGGGARPTDHARARGPRRHSTWGAPAVAAGGRPGLGAWRRRSYGCGRARAASPAARSGSGPDAGWPLPRRSRPTGDPAPRRLGLRAARARRRRLTWTLGQAGVVRAAPGRLGARVRRRGRRAPARGLGRGRPGPRGRRARFAPARFRSTARPLDLRASLGGREISGEEFRGSPHASQPLVRMGGEWRALRARRSLRARSIARSRCTARRCRR